MLFPFQARLDQMSADIQEIEYLRWIGHARNDQPANPLKGVNSVDMRCSEIILQEKHDSSSDDQTGERPLQHGSRQTADRMSPAHRTAVLPMHWESAR